MDANKLRTVLALMGGVQQQSGLGDVAQLAQLAMQQQGQDVTLPLRQAETAIRAQEAQSLADARRDRLQLDRDALLGAEERAAMQYGIDKKRLLQDQEQFDATMALRNMLAESEMARDAAMVEKYGMDVMNMLQMQRMREAFFGGGAGGQVTPEQSDWFNSFLQSRGQ